MMFCNNTWPYGYEWHSNKYWIIQHSPNVPQRLFGSFPPMYYMEMGTKRRSNLSHFSYWITGSTGMSSSRRGHTANAIRNIFALSPMQSTFSQAETSSKLNNDELNKITSPEAQLIGNSLFKGSCDLAFKNIQMTKEITCKQWTWKMGFWNDDL